MSATAFAQISITGTTYTQNFNAIGGEDVDPSVQEKTAYERNTQLPEGWRIENNTTSCRTVLSYASASETTRYIGGQSLANNAKNGTWNFGLTGSTDRAIGGITSSTSGGARTINVMAKLHNDAGVDYKSIALEYDIEKYRNGANLAGFVVQLFSSTDGETWTSAGSEFYITYSKDANTNGNEVVPIDTRTISSALNVNFNANTDLYLAWSISPASGDDCSYSMAFGIDNVSITPNAELADLYAISITGVGEVTENFNTIGGEDVDPTQGINNSFERATTLPKGWKVERNMNAPREVNSFGTATKSTMWIGGTSLPSNAKNGTWNFGATGSTDRAIGGLSTGSVGGDAGTRCVNVMARLHNDSETNLDVLSLSYDIKKYRKGSNSQGFTVQLYTSADGISWTSAGNSFMTTYVADAETNGYEDVPGNTTHVVNALHVDFPVGGDLYLAWNISVSSGTVCSNAQGLAIDNVSIIPAIASNELFATYQKQGDTFYKGNESINYSDPDPRDLDINYYIASCGQTMLFRAKNPGEDINFDGNAWAVQLRTKDANENNNREIQACEVVNVHHHYTRSDCNENNQLLATTEDLKIHFFLNSNVEGGYRITETFNYNRASINNPINDNTAPTLDPTKVTQTEDGADLVFTFDDGAVTASEEFFYYVADKDHSIGNISLTNEVRITKPTVQDGTTYRFKCYAVDYNGNMSGYKEFTLEMPFDENVDLALNKPALAGAVQDANTADKAVNGNAGNFWTCFGQGDASTTWWKVDLTNVYNLDHIKIHFNNIEATYNIYGSIDNVNWNAIVSEATATTDETKTHIGLSSSARYLKVTSSDNRFGIKEFEVYATGIATPDNTDPTVSVSCTAKTINTATLQITAADKDDLNNDGIITSIIITGDNGFVDQEVVSDLDGENKVTLSGLNYNTTYNFTVTVTDRAGNTASQIVEVELPFNTGLNLALNKTCSAGGAEKPAANANDGNAGTYWGTYGIGDYTTKNYWEVDLGVAYVLSRVVINRAEGGSSHAFTLQGKMKEGDAWSTIFEDLTVAVSTSEEKTFNAAARYLRFSALQNSMVAVNEFEVYGTAFAPADETNPTVAVTCPAKTYTSATLQIIAADEDDAHNAGTIRAINISGDNGFVTQNDVTLDGSNQITLSELKDNTTYTFTVHVLDLAGNETTEDIVVELPFNTDLNICLGKTATDGYHQGNYAASRAIDGVYGTDNADSKWNTWEVSTSTHGYDDNWMRVDLGAVYNLRNVTMSFDWHYGNPVSEYVIEGSLDDSNWYLIDHVTDQLETSASLTVSAPAQYVRFRAITHQSLGIYEFEVYASGFSTLIDAQPVVTYAKVGLVEDATAEIEIDAADITTKPITKYMVSGLGGDAQEFTASDGKITLTSLSQSTHYTIEVQAKDGNDNLSVAKQVEFTTAGSVSGLYLHSDLYGWDLADPREQFSTTAVPGVMSYTANFTGNTNHIYKLYNADITRCTWGECAGASDHNFRLASATDVTFYATDEDHFLSTIDNLYLRGSLVGEDQALEWNDAHTIATWAGTLDLSGTKQFTIVKKSQVGETLHDYDHDFYTEVQTFDGDYTYGVFTLNLTTMTGTWGHVELAFGDDAENNTATISENHNRVADVTINRNILADDTWYTLCLPFDMSAEKVSEVFGASTIATLESSEDRGSLIHLNFDYVNAIQAGKPYLIKPGTSFAAGTTISNVTIKNVDPSEAPQKAIAEHMHFQGTFDKIMLQGEDKRYVAANNELYSPKPVEGSKIGAFRCYFTIPSGSPAPGKQARIVFGPQNATGIDLINDSSKANGKLLINGVLYIIRDGNTYNAQGMLIK